MTECANVNCNEEATTKVVFDGFSGVHEYCDKHVKELRELEEEFTSGSLYTAE